MYTRKVPCQARGCGADAEYKIAANWSAGRFAELKTYALACESHSTQCFSDAARRRKAYPPSAEETQGEIGLYHYEKGRHDTDLERAPNPA